MECGECGAENQAGNRFCAACGTRLAARCPSCGEPVQPGAHFCGACGTSLANATAPLARAVQPAARAAERRVCSVLFVDLVGFTTLSEGRDPEEVRELLSRYFEVARTIVGRYGGVVEKFIGDAVMAVWGTPTATEGDAERAVRAGLELVAAVASLGVEVGAPGLAARAGVVTGEVAVTLGATGEGMVAGDAVNTAARVQGAALRGAVWVDGATRRLAASGIRFEGAGEHQLKGKAEPEELWRAVRVVSMVGGAQRRDGLEAPLVGRDPELRTVKDLFHAAAERRTPRLAVVSGAAGVGKSRLGWEFEKYIDGLADTVLWHRGRCLSYGEGVAFWALAEIVRQRFGIADEDTGEVASSKLGEGLVRFVADPAERSYIGVRLGRLLGVDVAGDANGILPREELFAGWRLFFERLAGVAPVVLLIEDAHHADPGLLDFVDHLVDWVRDLPVFVLVFGRPELVEGRAGFGSGRNRTALWLDPLDATSMDGLVDALVPGMPATARASITAQARGIPLFAVETIRSLIDREIVAPHEGMYRLVGDVGALTVPDSLHALLAARLDSLEPPIRDLVADASVIGSTFPAEAVIAISDQDERAVRAGLTELVRRDVLEVSSDPLSPQLGTYRFGQDMLRQVAYDTLGRRDRKTRHLTVAAHLRAVFAGDGEEVADVIARHYLDALDVATGDPDTAEIRELAIGMLTRAADRSERTGAPHPAAQSYALAAEQTELAGKEASAVNAAILWEKAGKAARDAADFESAIAYAERAQDHYTRLGMIRAGARAQTAATHALQAAGRRREARERLIAALVVLRPDPDVDTVRAIDGLATNETFSGGPDADRLSTEALVLGQALDVDSQLLITLLVHRGICLYFANRPVEATAHLEHGLKIAERSGDSSGQGGCLGNLSEILVQRDPIAAAAAAHAAEEHARRVGNVDTLTFALGNEASALIFGGNWDAAETLLHHARETGQIESFGYLAGLRAELAALRGDASTASDLAADPRLRASEDAQDQALVELCEALIALALNDPVATLAHAQAVIAYAPTLGIGFLLLSWAWPLAARTAHDLGDTGTTAELLAVLDAHPIGHLPPLLRAERALARARIASTESNGADALTAAVAELRKAPSPYHLAHGLLDQAQHHVDSGDQEAAGPLIEEARSIATTLRCPPLLQRADDMAGPDHTRRPNEETGSVYVDTP